MKNLKFVAAMVLGGALTAGGILLAQGPRHPNLEAAQTYIGQAMNSLSAAQQANEYDMGGHAGRAKELLVRASQEVRLAAQATNRR